MWDQIPALPLNTCDLGQGSSPLRASVSPLPAAPESTTQLPQWVTVMMGMLVKRLLGILPRCLFLI